MFLFSLRMKQFLYVFFVRELIDLAETALGSGACRCHRVIKVVFQEFPRAAAAFLTHGVYWIIRNWKLWWSLSRHYFLAIILKVAIETKEVENVLQVFVTIFNHCRPFYLSCAAVLPAALPCWRLLAHGAPFVPRRWLPQVEVHQAFFMLPYIIGLTPCRQVHWIRLRWDL